jgi:hypothetical protein
VHHSGKDGANRGVLYCGERPFQNDIGGDALVENGGMADLEMMFRCDDFYVL